ncbi:Di-copper centre-containing protein, partial [Lophiostoma macrostomum CBS 122681]
MKSTLYAVASLLTVICYGSPIASDLFEKRQGPGSYFAITGATGGVYPRLEIRELQEKGEMWNLYLLAMTDFQAMNQSDIASWYQIAGIHGMPWISWDGVEGTIDDKTEYQRGYCPHNQLLFGTWHRPYLALFEQQLQSVARGIAAQFGSSAYQTAATQLRTPYWDWAKAIPTTDTVLPSALTSEKVDVAFPNGTAASIDNPLYDYNFHPLDHTQINGTGCPVIGTPGGAVGGLPSVCENSQMTIRAGETTSDHAALESKLRSILRSQRSSLYAILSQYQSFNQFSNDGSCEDGGPGSLENLHNPIHTSNWPGHMSPASVSAFDPMFWMHHANVDRQMAIFQALYPDTYVQSCAADTPTYTISVGDVLDQNSPLTPFHRNKEGDFWTSAKSRNVEDMGYTYPELAGNPDNATLVANVKALYAGSATGSSTRKERRARKGNAMVYLAKVTLPLYGLANGEGGSSPYDVLIFLGDVPSDAAAWSSADSFVGVASTLGGLNTQSEQASTVTVDLTAALEQSSVEGNASTVDYLKANLHWRVGLGSFEIPRTYVIGVEVELISTDVEIATEDGVFDRWVGGFVELGKVDV